MWYRDFPMKVFALAAFLLGVVAAFLLRPRVSVGTEPGDPTVYPIFDPRTTFDGSWTA